MQANNVEFKTKNMFVQITSKSNFLAILPSTKPIFGVLQRVYLQNLKVLSLKTIVT